MSSVAAPTAEQLYTHPLLNCRGQEQKIEQLYPERVLTKHEKSLFVDEEEELPKMMDDGFRFGIQPEELEGRPEHLVKLLSTRTASIPEARKFRRSELTRKFRKHDFDTGSNRVKVAVLTEHVDALQRHLLRHRKDMHAKRSLLLATMARKKLLKSMMRNDYAAYRVSVAELGLKPLSLWESKYTSRRGNKEPHRVILARHARMKKRTSRGHKGH